MTVVEGDPKGGRYSIPCIAPLYSYLIVLSVKQGDILGLNLGLPDHWEYSTHLAKSMKYESNFNVCI